MTYCHMGVVPGPYSICQSSDIMSVCGHCPDMLSRQFSRETVTCWLLSRHGQPKVVHVITENEHMHLAKVLDPYMGLAATALHHVGVGRLTSG